MSEASPSVLCTFTKHSGGTTRQSIDHCQTHRRPRFIKLRLRVHNKKQTNKIKIKHAHKKGIIARLSVTGRKKKMQKERPSATEKGAPQWFCLLDWDQAADPSVSFQIVHIIAVKTFLRFQTQTDALHQVSLRTACIYMRNAACVQALTLAHFLSSKKW